MLNGVGGIYQVQYKPGKFWKWLLFIFSIVNDFCFPHLLLCRDVFSWAVCVKCQIFVKSLSSKFSLTPALCTSRQKPISKQLCWNIFRSTYIIFVSKAEKKWFISTILCFLNNIAFTVASASEKTVVCIHISTYFSRCPLSLCRSRELLQCCFLFVCFFFFLE